MSMEYYMVFRLHDDRVRIVRLPPAVHFDLSMSAEEIIERTDKTLREFIEQLEILEGFPYIYPDGKENHELSLMSTFSDLRYYSAKDVKEILEKISLEAWLAVSRIFGILDEICEIYWFFRQFPVSYKEAFKINEEDIEVVDQYTVRINRNGKWEEYKVQGVGLIWA